MTTHHANRRGFTLVELLVVVSIIALLISILLPSLRTARTQAKRTVCANHMHQLGLAQIAYAIDNNGCLVPKGFSPTGGMPLWYVSEDDGGAFAMYWAGHKSQGEKLLLCPSDKFPYPEEQNGTSTATNPEMNHGAMTSYGVNCWFKRKDRNSSEYIAWGAGGNMLCRIQQPSATMLMAEIWRFYAIMDRVAVDTGDKDAHYEPWPDDPVKYPGNLEWDTDERHDAILNVLLVDGHVENRTKERGFPSAAENNIFWGPNYPKCDPAEPPDPSGD